MWLQGPGGPQSPFRESVRSSLFQLHICVRPDLLHTLYTHTNYSNSLNTGAVMRI